MSVYLFGMGYGKLSATDVRARKRAARAEGCSFIHADMPGEGWRFWFSGPNLGSPFDQNMERRVFSALRAINTK